MRGEADLLTRRENRLAVGRGDGAGVGDVRPEERDTAADVLGCRRTRKLRASLHGDVPALAVERERGGRREVGRAVRAGVERQGGEQKLLVGIVQQAARDEVVVDGQRRSDERVRVHLRRAAEDDAILVDHVNLARRLDGAEDLRGHTCGVVDFVERDPRAHVTVARALVERERGVFADVERLPREQRLLRSLRDGDVRLSAAGGLRGKIRALPQRGIVAGRALQAARDEAVRHVGQSFARVIRIEAKIVRAGDRGAARSGLHRLHRSQRLRGARKRVGGFRHRRVRRRARGATRTRGCAGLRRCVSATQDIVGARDLAGRQHACHHQPPGDESSRWDNHGFARWSRSLS